MKKKKVFIGIGSVAALGALYMIFTHLLYVSTDNAQIGAHVVMLSSRVTGTIQKVLVEENQRVKAGETLAQIDTSDLSNASAATSAQVASLEARAREAEANYKRATELLKEQAISRESFEESQATYKETAARLKAAQAQHEQATLNVSYTRIVAPSDGMVARKSVEVGQVVSPGQQLFGFVSSDSRWVTANLKETDLNSVKIGQKVSIEVDAISGRDFSGEVESISPSTGAMFSLLPPDNATGNFTKVVQRVPVRIKLVNLSADDVNILRAGLSAVVDIKIR